MTDRVMPYTFETNEGVPNSDLPLLVYSGVLDAEDTDITEGRFAQNGWTGAWVNGVYDYHHYHSTAHEVLGVTAGSAEVQFGGPEGDTLRLETGDVVVIPAGVGHCNKGASADFTVVGAYAGGRSWDLKRADGAISQQVKENIAEVPLPEADPVFGEGGPLRDLWA